MLKGLDDALPATDLTEDVTAVLDIVLDNVVNHERTAGGFGANGQPVVVYLRDRVQTGKGQRQVQKVPPENAQASGHLVLGKEGIQINVLALR